MVEATRATRCPHCRGSTFKAFDRDLPEGGYTKTLDTVRCLDCKSELPADDARATLAANKPRTHWLCRLIGHNWHRYDANWTGRDYFRCWRSSGSNDQHDNGDKAMSSIPTRGPTSDDTFARAEAHMLGQTEPTNLPVSQEDREAAASIQATFLTPESKPDVLAGRLDWTAIVQAFARHRTQADAAGYARGGKVVTMLQDALKPFAAFDDGRAPFNLPITQGSGMARRQLTIGDCRNAKRALEKSHEGTTSEQALSGDAERPDSAGAADR